MAGPKKASIAPDKNKKASTMPDKPKKATRTEQRKKDLGTGDVQFDQLCESVQ
jgi:hypothetical protein